MDEVEPRQPNETHLDARLNIKYHHKEGVEGLNPGGGHFPPQDDAVGLLGGEKRERGACLLVGRPEENDEEGDDVDDEDAVALRLGE